MALLPLPPLAARSGDALPPAAPDHLESLYRFAQLLTADSDRAVMLVEAVFEDARTHPLPAADIDRVDFLRMLLQQHAALEAGAASTPAAPAPTLRRRLASTYVEQALPRILALLPPQDRLLLHLRLVEGLPWPDVSRLLDEEDDVVQQRYARAAARLQRQMRADASPTERRLLDADLPPDWLAELFPRVIANTFPPLPPTLQTRVEQALHPGAPNRARTEPASDAKASSGRRRALVVMLLILTAGLTGYLFNTLFQQEPETNLIALSVEQADRISPSVQSNAPEQLEQYVQDRLGWRILIPGIEDAVLLGVDVHEVAPDVQVPVLVFEDTATREPIIVFTYTYALLTRYGDRIELAPEILHSIEQERSFESRTYDDQTVLIWRNRDEIFLAVTPLGADAAATLPDRIATPS